MFSIDGRTVQIIRVNHEGMKEKTDEANMWSSECHRKINSQKDEKVVQLYQ